MPGTLNTRRAFHAIEAPAENDKKLDGARARLAAARIATERIFQETERLLRPADRGFAQFDANIDKPQARMDAERSRQLDARFAQLLADNPKLRRNWQ